MDALIVPDAAIEGFQVIGSGNLDIGKYYVLTEALREGEAYHAEIMLGVVEDEWLGPNGERQGVFYRRCRVLSWESGEWTEMPPEEPQRYVPLCVLKGPEVPLDELPQGESWHVLRFCVF